MSDGDATPLTLYGVPTSGNCQKAARMLTLCDLPATFRLVDLSAGAQHDPAFRRLNPMGEVPVLLDGAEAISQSPLILRHLADKTGRFGASDPAARRRVEAWLYFDQQRIFPGLAMKRFILLRQPEMATPDVLAYLTRLSERALTELDRGLSNEPYLAGAEPTIADIACSAYVLLAEDADIEVARWPAVKEWLGRLQSLARWTPSSELMPAADGPL